MISSVNELAKFALSIRQILGIAKTPTIETLESLLKRRLPGFMQQFKHTPHETRREEVVQMHTLLGWIDNGMPVFELTHGLMAALLLTDPTDVLAEDVKMPFPTFLVRFPQPFWQVQGNSGTHRPAVYALVHQCLTPKMMINSDGQAHVFDRETRIINRIVSQDGITQVWERRTPIPEAGPIAPWLAEIVGEAPNEGQSLRPLIEDDRHLLIAFRRLLINLCLYIAEHGRGEKISRPPKKHKSKNKSEPSPAPTPEVWILGREVKLDRDLVDSAKAWTESRAGGKRADGWKIRSRFTVRGHWRNQPCGEGRKERRLKWIAPHWKGEGPKLAHIYQVQDDTKNEAPTHLPSDTRSRVRPRDR